MSNAPDDYGKVDAQNLQDGSNHPVSATVGQSFVVTIPNSKLDNDPGASWFQGYDPQFLTMQRAGWEVAYDGSSVTWAQFLPTKAGTTVIEGVTQPHLINPLYITYNFHVTISS